MSNQIKVTLAQVSPTTTEGRARQHKVLCDRPEAKGGGDQGAMGGELFLLGLGGCFASNLLAAAKARDSSVDGLSIEVVGSLVDAPQRFAAVELRLSVPGMERADLERLAAVAEKGCIVANTIRGAVTLTVLVV